MTLRPRLPSPPTQVNPNQPTGGVAPIDPFPGTPAIPQPPPYQWFIPNDTSGGPEATPAPRQPLERTVKVSTGAEGRAIPTAYGACQVTGEVFVVVGFNGALVLAYALSLASGGRIEAVDSYTLNGYAPPLAGVTVETYLGNQTGASPVSPLLSAAISGYTQRHPGLASMVVSIGPDSAIFGGIPQLRANVRGRRVYDHRTSTTAYSANPALCARDLRVSPDGGNRPTSEIDEASVDAKATMCDVTVAGAARFTCGYTIQDRRPLREHLRALLEPASLESVLSIGGTWGLAGLVEGAGPVRTITQDDLFAEDDGRGPRLVEERPLNLDQVPTVLNARYFESTREWEDMAQTARAPYVLAGSERLLERDYPARSVVTAAVAARVAGDRLNAAAASGRLEIGMRRAGLKLLRGEVVGCQGFLGLGRTCLEFDGNEDYCLVSSPPTVTTTGTVEARFRCTGAGAEATEVIVEALAAGALGYSVQLSSSTGKLAVYFSTGDSATGLGYDLRDGLVHHVAVTRGNGTRFIVYLDGEEVHNAAATTASAGAADQMTFGARYEPEEGKITLPFKGTIEEVRVWNTPRTQDEIRYYRNRAPAGTEGGLVGLWRFDEGSGTTLEDDAGANDATISGPTWTTRPDYYVVGSVQPRLDGPQVDVDLAEWWPRSRATASVQSTGGAPTSRVDTRTPLPRNDPQSVPPNPSITSLTVQEDIVGGSTRYKLALAWYGAPSGFVRGYRISVSANGHARTLADTGRLASEALIDVLEPGYLHTVTLKAVGITGQLSTGVSSSVTPGTASTTLSVSAIGTVRYWAPINSATQNKTAAMQFNFSYAVGTPANVRSIELSVDGAIIGMLDPSDNGFEVFTAYPWRAAGSGQSFISMCSPGSSIELVATLLSGTRVSAACSAASVSAVMGLSDIYFATGDLAVGGAGHYELLPAVGASPNAGSVPWFNSVWTYVHGTGGVSTIPNGSPSVAVSFGVTFAAAPGIGIAAEGNAVVWVTSVTTTGMTINRSGTSGGLVVRWVAFGG